MKCSNCGSENKDGAKFCRECGAEIAEKEQAVGESICPECGNQLMKGALFCNRCGRNVSSESATTEKTERCPNCNKLLKSGVMFCSECGTSLVKETVEKSKKNGGALVFLIALLIAVLIGGIGAVGYLYLKNVFPDKDVTDANAETKDREEDTEDGKKFFEEATEEESGESVEPETEIVRDEDRAREEEYLFPSDRKYISEEDLIGKEKDEVAMIRNEIYARHGYIFNKEPFKSYFESKEWYVPNKNFNDSVFNEIEKTNKDFLVKYEKDRGWR